MNNNSDRIVYDRDEACEAQFWASEEAEDICRDVERFNDADDLEKVLLQEGFTVDKSLRMYLKEISQTAPVDSDCEEKLIKRLLEGDNAAKNELVEANLRLVVSIAKRYVEDGVFFLDLIQEGNLGLIDAVDTFDRTKGQDFINYAIWCVRREIVNALAAHSKIASLPTHVIELLHKVTEAQEKIVNATGREPTAEAIAKELGLDVSQVYDVLELSNGLFSLDESAENHSCGHSHAHDEFFSHDFVSIGEIQEYISEVLPMLSVQEQTVLRFRFGIGGKPHTLGEVCSEFHISREQVKQIEAKVFRRQAPKFSPNRFGDVHNS